MRPGWIAADWAAPPGVRALVTTRAGGVSAGSYASLNLGAHVGDDPAAVAENRSRLAAAAGLPSEPRWLRQVHGNHVLRADESAVTEPAADAAVTRELGVVLAVLTADCLPVLLAARNGGAIGIAHAGWRGLAAGVIEAAVAAMGVAAGELVAWLGPAIGQNHYEVGEEVRAAFAGTPGSAGAFIPSARETHWHCDLALLARARLAAAGVRGIAGGDLGTCEDRERFYSWRRDGETGRMASLIWMIRGPGTREAADRGRSRHLTVLAA